MKLEPAEFDAIVTAAVERIQASQTPKKRLFTVAEAAVYLGRSGHAIRHLVKARKLPTASATIPDGRIFLDRLDLDALIDGSKRTQ